MPFLWKNIAGWARNRRRRRALVEIDPDEVMLDSRNIPDFDTQQLEGRLEKPIHKASLYVVAGLFSVVLVAFLVQAFNLQISQGTGYRIRSENNVLRPVPIFASRGLILDRNGAELAWNAPGKATTTDDAVAQRIYATTTGLSHTVGYVQYPSKDSNGFYYQSDFVGIDGVEKYYNDNLQGVNGSRLVEVDAGGHVVSQSVVDPPHSGDNLMLSIDSRVQSSLYENIKDIATRVSFEAGAGVIMDVRTGEILAMTSYPEYDQQIMADKTDSAAVRAQLQSRDQLL